MSPLICAKTWIMNLICLVKYFPGAILASLFSQICILVAGHSWVPYSSIDIDVTVTYGKIKESSKDASDVIQLTSEAIGFATYLLSQRNNYMSLIGYQVFEVLIYGSFIFLGLVRSFKLVPHWGKWLLPVFRGWLLLGRNVKVMSYLDWFARVFCKTNYLGWSLLNANRHFWDDDFVM